MQDHSRPAPNILSPFTTASRETRREWARKAREKKALAKAKLAAAELLSVRVSPEAQLARARVQLSELLDRTEAALAALSPERPADHRALAATLVAISERLEALVALERASGKGGESYEARLRRAYREAGLPVPGRPGEDT